VPLRAGGQPVGLTGRRVEPTPRREGRAYAPEGKTKILTTVILVVFRGLKFESDPRGIGCAFHEAGADIGEKDSFRSGTS